MCVCNYTTAYGAYYIIYDIKAYELHYIKSTITDRHANNTHDDFSPVIIITSKI